ncbi:MAG: DUF4349 domain-containing protein [Chloroflexi bacterium]|nr:DUF4349 domain-containing protein [Chloroflexota bacterium]
MNATIGSHRVGSSRAAAIVAGLMLVAACGGAASAPNLDTSSRALRDAATAAPAPGLPGPESAASGSSGTTDQVLDAARPDLLIIKTGTLDIQVKNVELASTSAARAIGALGGYISGSQQYGDGDGLTASVTYRIPSDRWDEALAAMRSLAVKIVNEVTQTEDVTGQVVDLTARITNLKATEQALQAIMTKAIKISDVLAVQAELTKVRGDIEGATAEKQHLQEQASYSTLTVTFGLQPTAAVRISQQKFDPGDQIDRATASLVEILQGIATAGIWFAIVWLPILVVIGLFAVIAYAILRRRVRLPMAAWPPTTDAAGSPIESPPPPSTED